MDPSKWRIAKACQECRLRKIRCNGADPCQRCEIRNLTCVYRTKARNRVRKSADGPVGASAGPSGTAGAAGTAAVAPPRSTHHLQHRPRGVSSLSPAARRTHVRHQSDDSGDDHDANNGNNGNNGDNGKDSSAPAAGRGSRYQNGVRNHGVAATHRASPSVSLQLYYGPSSGFSLLNSIYHHIEGTRPTAAPVATDGEGDADGDGDGHSHGDGDVDGCTKEVQEFGPGLDLFNHRRVYFGDLVDVGGGGGGGGGGEDGHSATFLLFFDRALAERLLERYLATYWLLLPIWSPAAFRARLAGVYHNPAAVLTTTDPDSLIVLLALALGASLLDEELAAQYLYREVVKWVAALDDMVNIQTRARPNRAFLSAGSAVRRAVAAGLHKGVMGASHSKDDIQQARITIWSLYFWETWLCFSLGRPSSFPDADLDVPMPTGEKTLQALISLARIMDKTTTRIYRQHYDSLLPIWNVANEIRRELRRFAEKQIADCSEGPVGDPHGCALSVGQSIVSTLYHHTLMLAFRPFLVLRSKLPYDRPPGDGEPGSIKAPPAWLNTACEYCLDAARTSIVSMASAIETNELSRSVRYYGFFILGAAHVLAFQLLQDKSTSPTILPWLQLAIRALQRLVSQRDVVSDTLVVDPAGNLERIIRSVYPDFRRTRVETDPSPGGAVTATATGTAAAATAAATGTETDTAASEAPTIPPVVPSVPPLSNQSAPYFAASSANNTSTASDSTALPFLNFSYVPFAFATDGSSSMQSPATSMQPDAQNDLTAADLGLDFDFSTMNMEAFLSVNPDFPMDFSTY
ncbi:Zn(2)-C6 fungal-type DNA-binding domain protein [Niveomyces insectorum RCEF 264]|uniref:Zn(2)-C6 fungal-type DNA-binding domain protein n=1 Tax=Niveomyces insectorum RCEF 264 TaxID=1081102 RepID=A0A162J697_9HYPO|nr:Zn(2)-C6 fungal-type DNA-binding domain protein [Niveomyces insectorum RCEF 264]